MLGWFDAIVRGCSGREIAQLPDDTAHDSLCPGGRAQAVVQVARGLSVQASTTTEIRDDQGPLVARTPAGVDPSGVALLVGRMWRPPSSSENLVSPRSVPGTDSATAAALKNVSFQLSKFPRARSAATSQGVGSDTASSCRTSTASLASLRSDHSGATSRANDISTRISDLHEQNINLEIEVTHYAKMAKDSVVDFVGRAQEQETITQIRVQQAELTRLVLEVCVSCQSCRPCSTSQSNVCLQTLLPG